MVRSGLALTVILAAMLLLAVPAFGATVSDGLTGSAGASYAATPAPPTPPAGEDPRCDHLRLKLQKQKRALPLAKTKQKRAFIRRNMGITRRRLMNDGCTA